MPIAGLGLHILVAIFFAVHAVRNGRELYWLLILFSFPLIGSVVYFFAIFLPHSRMDRNVRRAGAVIQRALDPGRELREAREAFELTPTAHNQMRLASALFEDGKVPEAVEQYNACLQGPFAKDPEIGMGAARARLANRQPQPAAELLQSVIANNPTFRPEETGLLLASACQAAGRDADAGAQYQAMAKRFDSVESHAEYALWALAHGDKVTAAAQVEQVNRLRKHLTRHTLGLHQELLRRLDSASASLR